VDRAPHGRASTSCAPVSARRARASEIRCRVTGHNGAHVRDTGMRMVDTRARIAHTRGQHPDPWTSWLPIRARVSATRRRVLGIRSGTSKSRSARRSDTCARIDDAEAHIDDVEAAIPDVLPSPGRPPNHSAQSPHARRPRPTKGVSRRSSTPQPTRGIGLRDTRAGPDGHASRCRHGSSRGGERTKPRSIEEEAGTRRVAPDRGAHSARASALSFAGEDGVPTAAQSGQGIGGESGGTVTPSVRCASAPRGRGNRRAPTLRGPREPR
jgi:hypothetical protein